MLDNSWELETVELLRDIERERQRAEQDIVDAQLRLAASERNIEAIRVTLDAYRAKYKLPNEPIPDTATQTEYAPLGPSAMVERWADSHEGDLILKVAAREMMQNGLFRNYNTAYNSLRSTVARKRHFSKVGPGVYRRVRRPEIIIATALLPIKD